MNLKVENHFENQSSESDISQGENESYNRVTMLNYNRKEYLKQKSVEEGSDSGNQELSSDSSDDEEIYGQSIAHSNSNPKFMQNNFQITKGGQPIKVQEKQSSDEEEENDDDSLENDKKQFKVVGGAQYSESEDDSEEEDEEYNKYPLGNGINTVREDSQEDSDDGNIDHIEERIKKLERDLENRLGKQSDKKQVPEKSLKSSGAKGKAHPPIPQPKVGIITSKIKISSQGKLPPPNPAAQNIENRMNAMNEMKKVSLPISTINPKSKKNQVPIQVASKKVHEHKKKPKKPVKKVTNPESNPHIQPETQKRGKKQETNKTETNLDSNNEGMKMLLEKMSAMEASIKNLSEENMSLKADLQTYQQRQKDRESMGPKSKKKPLEELEKLKEFSKFSQNSKLEKQIELLQVIEKLQAKLKKSVNRKLLQHKGSSSAALLHKGLPASFLTNA